MLNAVFSDCFAQKNNFLTRIDARIKILLVIGLIAAILFSRTPYLALTLAILALVSLLAVRIPFKLVLFRMLSPLSIVVVIVLLQFFLSGKEGLAKGFLLGGKVIGCTALIVFLSMSTSVNSLLCAASWFRAPKIVVEITMITYRYVFVLIEDAITITDAQKTRLGYSSLSRSLRSLAELAGTIFIRAYDQSLATYEAMQMRGYRG